MTLRDLQRHAVDGIKRHALRMSVASRRAQAHILTEYLWSEEGAETAALHRTSDAAPPAWVEKLVANQLADEQRHAALVRERLLALGAPIDRHPPRLVRAKLWWIERATARYMHAFAAGPAVVLLAIAAQLEGTAVRMFSRHLAVLEERRPSDPITTMLRTIVADEQRHAKSCATAVDRLVRDDERAALESLRETIARIDRSFGVTISVAFWSVIAIGVACDRLEAVRALLLAPSSTGSSVAARGAA
ncbi:MAG: ferritin-like domain-containing protein [Kofleriaceae bacterium]|nr:ferritin-like domain-containing protein [Kofleriaceae bacterium]